jgi:hypothetical protein
MGIAFPELPPHYIFIRGDSNGDGTIDLADAIRVLFGLFVKADLLTCPDAADFDDSGTLEITDAIGVLKLLFVSDGWTPRRPYPAWGVDWNGARPEDPLGCEW